MPRDHDHPSSPIIHSTHVPCWPHTGWYLPPRHTYTLLVLHPLPAKQGVSVSRPTTPHHAVTGAWTASHIQCGTWNRPQRTRIAVMRTASTGAGPPPQDHQHSSAVSPPSTPGYATAQPHIAHAPPPPHTHIICNAPPQQEPSTLTQEHATIDIQAVRSMQCASTCGWIKPPHGHRASRWVTSSWVTNTHHRLTHVSTHTHG
jgi:hypothetical protein